MAFLCPIRIGRSRNKKERMEKLVTPSIGRITGSASIDTLVRVGLEKEHGLSENSKVVVLHDFTPQVDDELGVKRGDIVHILYEEHDWIYVIGGDESKQGFIPKSYCAAVGTAMADMALNIARKKPRERMSEDHHHSSLESSIAHSDAESVGTFSCRTEVHPFFKEPFGRYLVLYTFVARDENDLSVERGELVTVLNREDNEWFWVLRSDGQEGFVPSAFVYPADMIESHAQANETTEAHSSKSRQEARSQIPASMKKQDALESQKEYRYDTRSGTISQNTYHNSSVINAYNAVRVEVNNNELSYTNNHNPSNKSSASNGSGSRSQQNTLKVDSGKSSQNTLRSEGHSRENADEAAGPYRAKGSELVLLYDYKSDVKDELDVNRGEWVYADLNLGVQRGEWLWVYSPRLNKYGYIPKSYASSPAMTSL